MVWTVQHGCGGLAKAANTAKGQHPCGFPRGERLAKGWRISADGLRAGCPAVPVCCGHVGGTMIAMYTLIAMETMIAMPAITASTATA